MISHIFACVWCFVYELQKAEDSNIRGWLDKINDVENL